MENSKPSPMPAVLATIAYSLLAGGFIIYFRGRIFPITTADAGAILAGVFSPLAFLWLVYTAFAQKAELEMQREELRRSNETQAAQLQQIQAQTQSLISTRENYELQNRAYVLVEAIIFRDYEVGKRWRVSVNIKNSGTTPAFNLYSAVVLALGPRDVPDELLEVDLSGSVPRGLGANGLLRNAVWTGHEVSQEYYDQLIAGKINFFVATKVEYTDVFNVVHTTKFRGVLDVESLLRSDPFAIMTAQGNSAT